MPGDLATGGREDVPAGVDLAAYRRDGFRFPVRVVDARHAAVWRAEIEAVEARWRGSAELPRPFEDYARANFHLVCSTAARIAHHPAILDAVEAVIGPDVLCWMCELIVKEPHSPKILTMHQDVTYWGLDAGDDLVTAWLALSDATAANGAMNVVRGSHERGRVGHHDTFGTDNLLSRGQEITVEYDPADVVPVELRAGELSLHHGLTFHGSGPNTTATRRVALVFRYVSPAVSQHVGPTDYCMVVRGVNRSRNLLSTPAPFDDFAPAALVLHGEVTAAQAGALGAGAGEPLSYGR